MKEKNIERTNIEIHQFSLIFAFLAVILLFLFIIGLVDCALLINQDILLPLLLVFGLLWPSL